MDCQVKEQQEEVSMVCCFWNVEQEIYRSSERPWRCKSSNPALHGRTGCLRLHLMETSKKLEAVGICHQYVYLLHMCTYRLDTGSGEK